MHQALSCERDRLKFFPVMMFAIVMGMSGLTIMYQKTASLLLWNVWIGHILLVISSVIFVMVAGTYFCKWIMYPQAVKKEFSHPIRLNFFAAISISLIMFSIMYHEVSHHASALFWYIGAGLHFYLTMHTLSFWINHNQELDHSNPAWFIPIVGNVLVPIGGIDFASHGVLMYFFSCGIFFWMVLFAIVLNRIIFHHQLANKFMPTLFILIAPPSVGFIAYVKMFDVVDTFATVLFNLALFFTFLVAFMYKNFLKIQFFISWWAFVFPMAAMSMSAMMMYHQTHDSALALLSYTMVSLTTMIVGVVFYQTVVHMAKGEICVQE